MFEWELLAAADHDDLDDDAEYGDDHVSTDIGDYGADEADDDEEGDEKEGDVAAHADHPAPAHSHVEEGGGEVAPPPVETPTEKPAVSEPAVGPSAPAKKAAPKKKGVVNVAAKKAAPKAKKAAPKPKAPSRRPPREEYF